VRIWFPDLTAFSLFNPFSGSPESFLRTTAVPR
jgi:hypothetical protein